MCVTILLSKMIVSLLPSVMLNTDSSAKDSQIVIVDMLDDNREKSLGYFDMLRKKEN